jgi:hypothetical protein
MWVGATKCHRSHGRIHGNGQRFVEGAPGQQLMRSVEDVTTVLEACFANEVDGIICPPDSENCK